jgi:hypothetical protein
MMTPTPSKKEARDPNAPREARKRRKSAVYDHEGNEVLITMMCLKCKAMKPLTMFGLRKMADGAIRNQPWCRTCRSGASSARKKEQRENEPQTVEGEAVVAAAVVENGAADQHDSSDEVTGEVPAVTEPISPATLDPATT